MKYTNKHIKKIVTGRLKLGRVFGQNQEVRIVK